MCVLTNYVKCSIIYVGLFRQSNLLTISPLIRGTHKKKRKGFIMETLELKKLVEEMAKEIAASYKLESEYNQDFLAEMIRRKYWHPEEGITSIADRTGKKMRKINKKGTRIIEATPRRNLERLEAELDNSAKVKPEMGRGYLISNIVKAEVNEIREKLTELGDLGDEKIKS